MNIKDAIEENGKVRASDTSEMVYAEIVDGNLTWIYPSGIPASQIVNFDYLIRNDWEPYHQNIRPTNSGELWVASAGAIWFTRYKDYYKNADDNKTILMTHEDGETRPISDMQNIRHGRNGWTREFPIVEEK